jgi:hypothetical protein
MYSSCNYNLGSTTHTVTVCLRNYHYHSLLLCFYVLSYAPAMAPATVTFLRFYLD